MDDRISEWVPAIHWPPTTKKGECWHIGFNIRCENCKQVFNEWNTEEKTMQRSDDDDDML